MLDGTSSLAGAADGQTSQAPQEIIELADKLIAGSRAELAEQVEPAALRLNTSFIRNMCRVLEKHGEPRVVSAFTRVLGTSLARSIGAPAGQLAFLVEDVARACFSLLARLPAVIDEQAIAVGNVGLTITESDSEVGALVYASFSREQPSLLVPLAENLLRLVVHLRQASPDKQSLPMSDMTPFARVLGRLVCHPMDASDAVRAALTASSAPEDLLVAADAMIRARAPAAQDAIATVLDLSTGLPTARVLGLVHAGLIEIFVCAYRAGDSRPMPDMPSMYALATASVGRLAQAPDLREAIQQRLRPLLPAMVDALERDARSYGHGPCPLPDQS